MIEPTAQPPARMIAGALAHLAKHMETGCPRAAYLAAMLLDQIANDMKADNHLRAHARELVEILERDDGREKSPEAAATPPQTVAARPDLPAFCRQPTAG